MDWVDLRSDTVTLTTPEMRQAMATAEVGDDVYGDDPTVNRLQDLAAERMGKEAALFLPSGTMGNLAAILSHCGRGDEMILGDRAHSFIFEAGGAAALGGVQPRTVPNRADGRLELEAIEAAIRPSGDDHFPVSRLVCLENTHNLCGGAVLPPGYMRDVAELAHGHGLKLHVDGARIFNAAAACEVPAAALVAEADSITFCLSKGLCAPVGSLLCGDRAFIGRAHRMRKQLGGGMRQAGVLAAAGIVALQKMADRLGEDHARARRLANFLSGLPGVLVDNPVPESNMVYLTFEPSSGLDAQAVVSGLAERRIRTTARGPRAMRLVTHYWVDDAGLERVQAAFGQLFSSA
jgi:threonine aldolase